MIHRLLMFSLCIAAIACSPKLKTVSISPQSMQVVTLDEATYSIGRCEPSICIDPKNTKNIVAGSILDNFYASQDGGMTWSKSKLKSSHGVYGDPVLRMDGKGNAYFAHLVNPTGRAYQDEEFLNKIVVQRSSDMGKTWNDGTYPAVDTIKDHDKQWLYVSDNSDDILMTWTEFDVYGSKDKKDKSRILFSKSTDQAETWTDAVAINDIEGDCIDDDYTTEGALPILLPDGDILVTWSFDDKIWLDRSSDGGKTWGQDKVIVDQPGGWSFDIPQIGRCNGMPILDYDRSNGPHSGTIYMNWGDQRNGATDTDIWLLKSTDNGHTWSKPIRVNNDAPGKHQFFSWMDVDPVTGYVYVVFYDRRAYDDAQTDVYLAYSTDGGESFENVKISKEPFTPNRNVFFGDYNDISAHNGMVRPVWTTLNGATLSVKTALLELR